MARTLTLFVLLSAGPIALGSSLADEIRASRSETRTRNGRTSRSYAGEVTAILQHSRIRADSAAVTAEEQAYHFYKNVQFQDDRYTLFADRLTFDSHTRITRLSGGVRLADEARTLSAREVTYRQAASTVNAKGDVRIALAGGGHVRANRWFRSVSGDSSVGSGSVRYRNGENGTLTIESPALTAYEGGDSLRFTNGSSLAQGAWASHSASTTILRDAGRVELEGEPSLTRTGREAYTIRATASMAVLELANEVLSVVNLLGSADLTVSRKESAATIQADTCALKVDGDQVSLIEAQGNVRIHIGSNEAGKSSVNGGSSLISFKDGEPVHIRVDKEGSLLHASSDSSLVIDIDGYGLTLDLSGSDLKTVRIDSAGLCRLGGNQPTHLSGDRVFLLFEERKLVRAEIEGHVKGHVRESGVDR